MADNQIRVVEDENLSGLYDKRYVVIDAQTGEVLDNAQGYGYKSPRNAYAAFGYKHRDKTKDVEKLKKAAAIKKWMREHYSFLEVLDQFAFEIAKGSCDKNIKINAAFIRKMFKDYDYNPDFTAGEFLTVYRKLKK